MQAALVARDGAAVTCVNETAEEGTGNGLKGDLLYTAEEIGFM